MFLSILSLIACDVVKPELLDAELDSRDLQIAALEARLTALEATVEGQAATIATQEQALASEQADRASALAALGESLTASDEALSARVTALEAQDLTQGDTLAAHDAALTVLAGRADATDTELAAVGADVDTLAFDVALLELGISAAETRLDLLESADTSGLDARVSALEDAADAAGETWSATGSGYWSGACASGTPAWHTVASVDFTPSVDGAVLVDVDGQTSPVADRVVVRDASGSTVATYATDSLYSNSFMRGVFAARVDAGTAYTASFEASDDCRGIAGPPSSIVAYALAFTVTTL